MLDVPDRWNTLARHAADKHIPVEIDQTVSPRRVTGMCVVVAECIPTGASEADLGLRAPKGKSFLIRDDQPKGQGTFRDPGSDLLIELLNIPLPHRQDLSTVIVHRYEV